MNKSVGGGGRDNDLIVFGVCPDYYDYYDVCVSVSCRWKTDLSNSFSGVSPWAVKQSHKGPHAQNKWAGN